METTAHRVIAFLADLHAMDQLQYPLETPRHAVIDLQSATIYEAHADYADAQMVQAELSSGHKIAVSTHKLVEHLLERHAKAMAILAPSGGVMPERTMNTLRLISRLRPASQTEAMVSGNM